MLDESDKITAFGPPDLSIQCATCNRHGEYRVYTQVRRFGPDITVAEWMRKIAEEGGCARVADNSCMAYVHKTSVTWWARLSDATNGGWRPILRCLRRHYALKRVNACPPVELDLRTLVATHGTSCKLERLERWAKCPQCGSDGATIQWAFPNEDIPDMPVRRMARQ